MKTKQVEIFVPVYNNAATLAETLASLLQQSYRDLKLHIYDNGSSDGSDAIARDFAEKDSRIQHHRFHQTVSAEDNFNRCIAAAGGDYFAIFHADDVYGRDMVAAQVHFLESHKVSAVSTHSYLIDAKSRYLGERHLPDEIRHQEFNILTFKELFQLVLKYSNFVTCPSVMIRTSALSDIQQWNGTAYKSSADLDMWLRLAQISGFGFISRPLMRYRQSASSFSFNLFKVRVRRHDLFLVLDAYMQKIKSGELGTFSVSEIHSLQQDYDFLLLKDNALITYNLLKGKKVDPDLSVQPFRFAHLRRACHSLYHLRIFASIVAITVLRFLALRLGKFEVCRVEAGAASNGGRTRGAHP